MEYGFFDDLQREYVITRPDTPAPWANYLGSPEYGALISNNAGGYSFAQSGANGRILRYVFNNFDQPGRYVYLFDNDSKDYWSASWQPVGKPLDVYKSECRHGLGYTRMVSEYAAVKTVVSYYVPKDKEYEVWAVKVTNNDSTERTLTVTGYAEFTNNSNYEQDQVNLQYSQYITRTRFTDNRITQLIHGNLEGVEEEVDKKTVVERFFGLAAAKVDSFCGSKDEFIGKYNGYAKPQAVTSGACNGKLNYNGNSCGALATKITLKPGESKVFAFVLGMKYSDEAAQIIAGYDDCENVVEKEIAELKAQWNERLESFQVETPSKEFNSMINTWNAYNCFMTFIWSRAASFTYCGLRNGYGYRDTVQDIQGIIHLMPEMAAEKIRFMLSAQVNNGGGLPLVKFTHNAGHEDTPDDPSYVKETGHPAYRADDALWLFPTVYKYVSESGNLAFLDEVIPYANKDEDTVYEHLKKAVDFSMNRLGPHGMPAGLYADWNDCLRLGANGESTFVAFQFYYAMSILRIFAEVKKDLAYIDYLDREQAALKKRMDAVVWDNDRFIRGFTEAGETIGAAKNPEANMWLNPQSWSVISGYATDDQAKKALDMVESRLNTDYGVVLMDPPFHKNAFDGALAVIYNAGVKENSGIFSQTQGWIILAESLMGHGDRAFRYYKENCPAIQNSDADTRVLEPYCYGQFTEGKDSPMHGRSHVHWLTGTASTMMVGCVEGILGMRPEPAGLRISPSIPQEWDELTINKTFRGKKLVIRINNSEHHESGVKKVVLNGTELSDNLLTVDILKDVNDVEVYL